MMYLGHMENEVHQIETNNLAYNKDIFKIAPSIT